MWCRLCCRSGAQPSGGSGSGNLEGCRAGFGADLFPVPQAGACLPILAVPRTRCLLRSRELPPCFPCRDPHPWLLHGCAGAVQGRGCCPQVRGGCGGLQLFLGGTMAKVSVLWAPRGGCEGDVAVGTEGRNYSTGKCGSGCKVLSTAPCLQQPRKAHSQEWEWSQEQLPRRGKGKSSG